MTATLRILALALVVGVAGCESLIVPDDALKQEFLAWEFGMFIHFNMATFHEREWANGYEDPATFRPDSLDMGQWADAAVAAGMRYAVLTVKHTGGWALWNSRHTVHDAGAFTGFRDGKGDLVREFVETFRSRGLRVGLYYCLPGDYAGRFGNELPKGRSPLHGYPAEAQGDYLEFTRHQLTELLTNYGPIDLIWMDQYRSRFVSPRDWRRIRNHIKGLQPATFVIGNDARRSPESDIHSYEYPAYAADRPARGVPPADNTHPAEVSDVIGPSWFWNTSHADAPARAVDEIVHMRRLANQRHANYLLNVSPDTTGRLSTEVVRRLREVGEATR